MCECGHKLVDHVEGAGCIAVSDTTGALCYCTDGPKEVTTKYKAKKLAMSKEVSKAAKELAAETVCIPKTPTGKLLPHQQQAIDDLKSLSNILADDEEPKTATGATLTAASNLGKTVKVGDIVTINGASNYVTDVFGNTAKLLAKVNHPMIMGIDYETSAYWGQGLTKKSHYGSPYLLGNLDPQTCKDAEDFFKHITKGPNLHVGEQAIPIATVMAGFAKWVNKQLLIEMETTINARVAAELKK